VGMCCPVEKAWNDQLPPLEGLGRMARGVASLEFVGVMEREK